MSSHRQPIAAAHRGRLPLVVALAACGLVAAPPARAGGATPANVLLVSVDTLRADHVSGYGYARPTSPNLDRLLARGARFDAARTVEPLTSPAMASVITSRHPHEHGGSRNGLRVRTGLASLPKTLQAHGYATAAFVGSWVLRDKFCGLGEHFETYSEVLTRRRWFGLVRGEATGDDVTARALAWIAEQRFRPWLAWLHYAEPHAPYRAHAEHAAALGLASREDPGPIERYDMEIAFVDRSIGELLERVAELGLAEDTLVVFLSDHGESLGEHGYWGHGRQVFETELRVPLAFHWPARIAPQTVESPALLLDVAPTVLGLLGHPQPEGFQGFDWSAVLGGAPAPARRPTFHQAHRSLVLSAHDSSRARAAGLLEVALIDGTRKEVYRPAKQRHALYDLATDGGELRPLSGPARAEPSEALLQWLDAAGRGLGALDLPEPEPLDQESADKFRALGYVD